MKDSIARKQGVRDIVLRKGKGCIVLERFRSVGVREILGIKRIMDTEGNEDNTQTKFR